MSYSISFVRCEPGMTASQTLEWLNSTWDGDVTEAPLALSHDQQRAWELVVERSSAEFGRGDQSAFDGHPELAWSEPRIRLEYSGSSASITMPYWYLGATAIAAVERAYGIGRLVEELTGLQAIDGQTGGGLTPHEVQNAVRAYVAMSEAAEAIRRRH